MSAKSMAAGAIRLLAALAAGGRVERPRTMAPMRRMPSNATCRWCTAPIVWADTPAGGRVPLDRHPGGDLVLVDGVAVEFGPPHEGRNRFVRHFAACNERRTS